MIQSYTMAPDRLVHDAYRADHAVKPWNSVDAMKPPKKIHTCDPQEQINRCLECPIGGCNGGVTCVYRKGEEDEPQMPKGYDEEKMKKAMAHAYTKKDLAKALGLSLYMTKKWLEWWER